MVRTTICKNECFPEDPPGIRLSVVVCFCVFANSAVAPALVPQAMRSQQQLDGVGGDRLGRDDDDDDGLMPPPCPHVTTLVAVVVVVMVVQHPSVHSYCCSFVPLMPFSS
mmetsp:Transcript_67955/g.102500  ORF Transcript_67955/g.102500 Transcript_67955/m.102500 type:complete len:110 (-) Transcript_67955:3-332(-)